MIDWRIRGPAFSNCSCEYACPCQFGMARPSHGFCLGITSGRIDEGHFGATRLDGLCFALLFSWPGPIHEGNGTSQAVIDERADAPQRDALLRILRGDETEPGATHFYVFHSTMSRVLDPIQAPIEFECDIEARRGRLSIPGVAEVRGEPIVEPVNGNEHRVRIDLPHGFEYRIAEIGRASSRATAGICFELDHTYGQFNELHLTGRGVVR
jgi:hypothetical protein